MRSFDANKCFVDVKKRRKKKKKIPGRRDDDVIQIANQKASVAKPVVVAETHRCVDVDVDVDVDMDVDVDDAHDSAQTRTNL